jgi:two-component system response regulator AlgR
MTEPLRVLIADDEPPARALLGHLLTKLGAQVVAEAEDGAQAVRLAELLNPDCALLDIAMPGLSGMDAARELVRLPAPPAIIFCTAFDGYAVAAFEVRAADYLLKPVEEERLAQALQRVAEAKPKIAAPGRNVEHLWVPSRSDLLRVDAATIERVEAERDYVRLHIGGKSCLLRATMDEMERRLDPALFMRIHRSTLVRRDMITGMRHEGGGVWSATLAKGVEARIGRSYLDAVRALARSGLHR